jgi:hypothetical protein
MSGVLAAGLALALFASPIAARSGEPAPPPRPLACLARYYGVRPLEKDGAWYAVLPGGGRSLYDYGEERSFEERLRVPDLHDTFSVRYRRGPIHPVTDVDDDPGRIRHYPLFDAIYPEGGIVEVRLFGQSVEVHRKIAPALARVGKRLERAARTDPTLAAFFHPLGHGYARRAISGTARASAHDYGIAIDLNPRLTDYWRWGRRASDPVIWKNRVPQAIVDAFEAEGFIWGGRWYHFDTGHFEYRPELLDPACYSDVAR